jgi:hypothetical protein
MIPAQVSELLHCSATELCWYFNATREQFRISGHVTVVGDISTADHVGREEWPNYTGMTLSALHQHRLLAWEALSDASRASYL